jgi:hypothetical protein
MGRERGEKGRTKKGKTLHRDLLSLASVCDSIVSNININNDERGFGMNAAGIIIVAAGLFSVCGAVWNWDWFINSRKARGIVALCGRNGARVFYGLLGTAMSVLGLLVILDVVDVSRFSRHRNSAAHGAMASQNGGAVSGISGQPTSPAVVPLSPEQVEREAVLATQALRPDNTNPAAYTKEGGRRSDDPEPSLLPEAARGSAVTILQVNALWGEGWGWYVQRRVREVVAPKQLRAQMQQDSVKLTFPGLDDLDALAKTIDFGTVTNIDKVARVIEVKADPTRFPKPQRIIEDPDPALEAGFSSRSRLWLSRSILWTSCCRDSLTGPRLLAARPVCDSKG